MWCLGLFPRRLFKLVTKLFALSAKNCCIHVQWQSLLRGGMEHEVFLAIDNVCNESLQHAEALLEMGFHPESLVIVTLSCGESLL